MKWREFHREGRDNTLVWRIAQEGDNYFTEHGITKGSFQKFSDTPGPKGKEGTKAYVSSQDNCSFHEKFPFF